MKRLLGLAVSLALLAGLYAVVDLEALAAAVRQADPAWLAAGLSLVVPLTLLTARRFTLVSRGAAVGLAEASRLVLASSTLNLFLPSKMGDLAKSVVLTRRHGMERTLSVAVVVLEKTLDMVSLLFWGIAGILYVSFSDARMLLALAPVGMLFLVLLLLISPLGASAGLARFAGRFLPEKVRGILDRFSADWTGIVGWFWQRPGRALGVVALSVFIWAMHMGQFWLFTRALGGAVPLLDNMAFATLSILVGLLPFTFAGVGTRDAAIVLFYAPYLSPGQGAFLGILATIRYLLPAVAGVPFVSEFYRGQESLGDLPNEQQ
jgi:uncharacterized protein (TIRG00374 family)